MPRYMAQSVESLISTMMIVIQSSILTVSLQLRAIYITE